MFAVELVVQSPVPEVGLFPISVAVFKQVVWLIPAKEGVGGDSLVMVTVLSLGGQVPLLIVHLNTLAPMARFDTLLLLEVGLFTIPAPLNKLHAPVPTVGIFPFKLAVVAHIDWSTPAFEAVGVSKRVTVMVLTEGGQVPLLIVHVRVVVPNGKPLTLELAELALLKLSPAPVQIPKPMVGWFALSVVLSAQTTWFAPAFAVVGEASLVMLTVLSLAGQVPLLIVHLNTLAPIPKFDTMLLFEVGEPILPAPLTKLHKPVPTTGVLPDSVALVAQTA
jgi:hypothetical protein